MKKNKIKSLIKTKRKAVRKDIKQSLISGLKEITGKLGQDSKKLNKEIEKSSNQIAKKLSKELKIDKSDIEQIDGKTKTLKTAKKVTKPEGKKLKPAATARPVSKKPAVKPTTTAKPVKSGSAVKTAVPKIITTARKSIKKEVVPSVEKK